LHGPRPSRSRHGRLAQGRGGLAQSRSERREHLARDPSDLPPPVGAREPATVRFELEAIERVGRLADNATYEYWTFNGKVPGPFLRVRVGDTVIVTLKNAANSVMPHNIDLHAVHGPGGGGGATEAATAPLRTKYRIR
jgi:nitrite reductase (NO-forming)